MVLAPAVSDMHQQQFRGRAGSRPVPPDHAATLQVNNESLVLRNYDTEETHTLDVTLLDPSGDVAFDRTVTVDPRATVCIETRLERAVYRVSAHLETGTMARTDCLIGSGPDECAVIETGNGTVSVSDGLF